MPFVETTATRRVKRLQKRIRLLAGGTSASKTISALLYLIAKCQYDTTPTLTSVVSESFPHLRRGAMRDFLNIMTEHGYFDDNAWSKTDYTYTFPNGSKLEFFSSDQPSKVRGPRRDRLYVNEANNVPAEAWEQLLLRTKEFAIADWNPVSDFYMYELYGLHDDGEPYSDDPDVDFLILTYQDNEALDAAIRGEIEKRRINKKWFRVYGEGKRGDLTGRIYSDWYIEDIIPPQARLERRGLDFGYSNDPTAIVDIYYYNGGYILDEQVYQKGLSNKQIADLIGNMTKPNTLVICDSAEPKSIDELKLYGINAIGANKGQGSILQGIQYVQDQQISITSRSVNLRKEYRNYMWKSDPKDPDRLLNVPEDIWNHALDAVRYAFESLRPTHSKAPVTPSWIKQKTGSY